MVKYRIVSNDIEYRIEIKKKWAWYTLDLKGRVLDLGFEKYFDCGYQSEKLASTAAITLLGSTAERYREWRTV